MGPFRMFPDRASTFAGQIDFLYIVLILLSAAFAIPVVFLLVYFSVKYRRSANVDRSKPFESLKLEIAWIIIPFVLAMAVFVWSAVLYFDMFSPPANTLELTAVGKQWMWKFQHPDGPREINELHVPVGQPVKLTMISQDVIHSFYVPAFRVKMDVVPGRYTTAWFEATQTGEYDLFCAEYCGAQHAGMIGRVVVMEPREYEEWLSGGRIADAPEAAGVEEATGEQLFQQLGCAGCHVTEGTGVGPSLEGIFGEPVRLEGGETVIADENYIRESILFPNRRIVEGYEPVMPSYQGQVTEEQILLLIEYIQSLASDEGIDEAPETDDTEETDGAEATPEMQTPQEIGD